MECPEPACASCVDADHMKLDEAVWPPSDSDPDSSPYMVVNVMMVDRESDLYGMYSANRDLVTETVKARESCGKCTSPTLIE